MVKVRGHDVEVDIERELKLYEWKNDQIRGNKFQACSPFRSDRHPSFAVNLDSGVWIDSGSSSDEWRKGSFVRLLSFLRGEQTEDTEDYLIAEYGVDLTDTEALTLDMNLALDAKPERIVLDDSILRPLWFRHPYLAGRGVTEEVQRLYHVGYDRERRGVAMPWRDRAGRLVNVKYRSVDDKRFWYQSGGDRIRNHVYGMHIVVRNRETSVVVVESEIDAMYVRSCGFPAVALGGANLTDEQRTILLRSPITSLLVATDNDAAGDRVAEYIAQSVGGYMDIARLRLPPDAKDVNNITREYLQGLILGTNVPFLVEDAG